MRRDTWCRERTRDTSPTGNAGRGSLASRLPRAASAQAVMPAKLSNSGAVVGQQ